MVTSLLYVSRSNADPSALPADVEAILAVARPRNLSLGVTGALLAESGRFAQVLEGSGANIDALMDSIRRDVRHRDVRVVLREEVEARRFASWSMAHIPPSHALDALMSDLSDAEGDKGLADTFIEMLRHSNSALLRL